MPASTSTKPVKPTKPVPAAPGKGLALVTRDAFGPPPLLEGEDPAAYEALLKGVRESVAPEGLIEDLWVRDVVDITWDILRVRRIKAMLVNAARVTALNSMIDPEDLFTTNKLVESWERGDPTALKEVPRQLAKIGLSMDDVNARAFALKLEQMERLDRIMAQAEARRNQTLREIERRRETLARRLRDRVCVIQDGEFREIADGSMAGPEPAP